MVKKYRKKPVIIESIQWTGKNLSEIDNFMGWIVENKETTLVIHTLEGDMEEDHVTFCGEEEFEQEGGWWSPEEVIRIDLSKVTKEMSL